VLTPFFSLEDKKQKKKKKKKPNNKTKQNKKRAANDIKEAITIATVWPVMYT